MAWAVSCLATGARPAAASVQKDKPTRVAPASATTGKNLRPYLSFNPPVRCQATYL